MNDKRKMLMIDDDPDLLSSFSRVMSLHSEWEFHTAPDAGAGLAKILSVSPDVVILDYDLGPSQKSGLEFLRELRERPEFRALPVLLFTGVMLDTVHRAAGLDLGAVDYVLKPVTPPMLLAKANAAIRKRRGGPKA